MNLIFTCGGTAGHINPAIAVANMMKHRHPECNILFIGATGHMEEKLVPKAGYELRCLPASGLSRKINLAAMKKNLYAVKCVLGAVDTCKKIIREFQPDVILGTGGYASFPALYAGSVMGVPTCVHEANALPGLTTKLAASRVDRVLVAFEQSVAHYKKPEKVQVVGMPVHRDFIYTNREESREKLGLGDMPLVVSAFGSQGAKVMNETVAELFRLEKEDGFPFRHIHATGSFGWAWMPKLVAEKGVDLSASPQLEMREYIYNMPELMAAADVFIGRAGSGTCNEIAVSGTPAILIPSPNVTANHQEKNARVLCQGGGATWIPEGECMAQALYTQLKELLKDRERRLKMTEALQLMAVPDSTERICDILEELIRR